VRELYAIPRGIAAYVTEAIAGLQHDPFRPDAELLSPNVYRLIVRGHIVEYSIDTSNRIVKILFIF
jgi:hypothetical protein